jgi:putative transposase
MKGHWPITLMCAVLECEPQRILPLEDIARAIDSDGPRRTVSDDALLVHIRAVHAESRVLAPTEI